MLVKTPEKNRGGVHKVMLLEEELLAVDGHSERIAMGVATVSSGSPGGSSF